MHTTSATVFAGLIGVGIIFIGLRVFWAPQAAVGFGIPDTPTEDRTFQSWLTVKAVRDIACGVFIFVLVAGASPHLLGWFLLTATAIPTADAVIVLRSNGSRVTAYGVHGATAAVMLVVSLLIIAT